ncbi:hypothetical protein JL720_10244 [Aureococcus anophagefferens]|nr:hypothetical protein JL720_10244 [Aureococcus anophagefferens]
MHLRRTALAALAVATTVVAFAPPRAPRPAPRIVTARHVDLTTIAEVVAGAAVLGFVITSQDETKDKEELVKFIPEPAPAPAPAPAPVVLNEGDVSEADVLACQDSWAGAIAACSKIYAEGGDYIGAAADAANELYGYGFTKVLFKPTKAAEYPFRPTGAEAMSYFVGGGVVENGYDEDAGFAINGGNGWEKVEFFNHGIDLNGPTATAMGYYIFTDATTKDKVRVEYTFGYKRCSDGKVRIYNHHSSVPYGAAPPAPAPITEEEVLDCQAKWANAIKTISSTYLAEGDFIGAAADAANELYGYGKSEVLFKPTKAAEFPFRPTGAEAMSYFVGGKQVEGGYDEDAGFAINGGKGWKDVVFTNHGIELLGPAAVAMGSYVFTCATTGDEAKVEYTFGYQRNDDGKPRIFLHHSSVPYSA